MDRNIVSICQKRADPSPVKQLGEVPFFGVGYKREQRAGREGDTMKAVRVRLTRAASKHDNRRGDL